MAGNQSGINTSWDSGAEARNVVDVEGVTGVPIQRFYGTSLTGKPKPLSQGGTSDQLDIPAGSSFFELDTGRLYRWDGVSQWVVSLREDDTVQLLRSIDHRLERLVELAELIIGS